MATFTAGGHEFTVGLTPAALDKLAACGFPVPRKRRKAVNVFFKDPGRFATLTYLLVEDQLPDGWDPERFGRELRLAGAGPIEAVGRAVGEWLEGR